MVVETTERHRYLEDKCAILDIPKHDWSVPARIGTSDRRRQPRLNKDGKIMEIDHTSLVLRSTPCGLWESLLKVLRAKIKLVLCSSVLQDFLRKL